MPVASAISSDDAPLRMSARMRSFLICISSSMSATCRRPRLASYACASDDSPHVLIRLAHNAGDRGWLQTEAVKGTNPFARAGALHWRWLLTSQRDKHIESPHDVIERCLPSTPGPHFCRFRARSRAFSAAARDLPKTRPTVSASSPTLEARSKRSGSLLSLGSTASPARNSRSLSVSDRPSALRATGQGG